MSKFRSGVLFGKETDAVLNDAKANGYALPAVKCVSLHAVNAAMETAARVQSPVIIQFSMGGRYCTTVPANTIGKPRRGI